MRRVLVRLTLAILICVVAATGCNVVPKNTLKSTDIPVCPGTEFSAYQNTADAGLAPVSIKNEGPWDFTDGPAKAETRSVLISKEKAAGAGSFDNAKYAEKVLPSDFTRGYTAYNFAEVAEAALYSYGQSITPGPDGPIVNKYDRPERLLKFPLRVGDKWADTIKTSGELPVTIELKREVIAKGQVKVPAGSFFDCFMVRLVKTTTTSQDTAPTRLIMYFWWAPGVGLVAAAGSQPDEEEMYFKQADYLFRLKSYDIAD